jgi:effector-binding domain-containing protein
MRSALTDLCRRVCGQANAHNIGDRIIALLSEVWDFLKDTGIKQTGHNVVLYGDEASKALLRMEDEVPIEVGVQVAASFESQGRVVCSVIPGGTVATAVHLGPYQKLPEAHMAIREWCAANGHALAGPTWETYGDWSDNPAELCTDVFYLLK